MTTSLDSLLTSQPIEPVLKIAVACPLRQTFDYLPPPGVDARTLSAGVRIEVPFGPRTLVGVLLGVGAGESAYRHRLKAALAVLDPKPLLSADDCAVLAWASRYYHHPIGEVFATALPALLRQGQPATPSRYLCLTGIEIPAKPKLTSAQAALVALLKQRGSIALNAISGPARRSAQILVDKGWACYRDAADADSDAPPSSTSSPSPHTLNPAQQAAVQAVTAALGHYQAFLLHGVTGSGKTEVYLQLVEQVLAGGRQALVLVPEINLTPQLEARFRARFAAPLAVFHSNLSDTDRCRAWLAMQRGSAAILLGTRSAVFTPLARPGLIILDEEHDSSFSQQDRFRFSARDVAVVRARRWQVPILLGSATPSLESLHNVERGRYTCLSLPHRTGVAKPPILRLLDIRRQRLHEGLSATLIEQIAATLDRREQALLFLNRRGFAPTLICHACGWVAECPRCDARLVLHSADRQLRCHHCGYEQATLRDCPHCRTADLRPLGLGTERVEQALAKLFPAARTLRIDRDSTRHKGSLDGLLQQIHAGEVDILLGTQMLAKGHHFPGVTLVGILDVDGGLFSLDFRASERLAQTVVQVAGRAGREARQGVVLLQTRQPDHPLLRTLIRDGYSGFAAAALAERQSAELPPYSHQALWRADARDAESPQRLLAALAQRLGDAAEVIALGPVAAPMSRRAGYWRSQLLLQAADRKPLHNAVAHLLQQLPTLTEAKQVYWSVDIDPVDLY